MITFRINFLEIYVSVRKPEKSGRIETFEKLIQQNLKDPKFQIQTTKDELNKSHNLIFLTLLTCIFLHCFTKPRLERQFSEVPLESNILFLPTQSGDAKYNGVRSDGPIKIGDTVAIRINQRPLTGDDKIQNLERIGLIDPPDVDAYATKVVALEGDTITIDGMRKGFDFRDLQTVKESDCNFGTKRKRLIVCKNRLLHANTDVS